jgi:regulator of sigma E protease
LVFLITGLISISLGIFNLLPIGFLDGGQIFLSIIEILRGGRRVSSQAQSGFFLAGMVLIASFIVFRMYKDMYQYVLPGKENVMQGMQRKPTKSNPPPASNLPANNAPVK